MSDMRIFLSSKEGNTYTPDDIDIILDKVLETSKTIRKPKHGKYYNIPCAFDIETSSFYDTYNGVLQKRATMYAWMFGIDDYVIIGRNWGDFMCVCDKVVEKLDLSDEQALIVYVHNLSYEFQFIRKLFKWVKVFSVKVRTPLYARTVDGIEFRCSYLLSGYSLAKVGEMLQKYKVTKMVGDLDYKKVRHTSTPLSDKELRYCENDVRVVMCYIREKIETDGNITKIPLTKTGYVRNYCRRNCYNSTTSHHAKNKDYKYSKYRRLMKSLTIKPNEMPQLHRAFQGGFTHACPLYVNDVIKNIHSFDFTSSYPYVMISEKYPMSRAEEIKINNYDEFKKNLKLYCCIFDVELIGVKSKVNYETPISYSKCWDVTGKYILNNGRIYEADNLKITLTNVDWSFINYFYKFEKVRVFNFKRYLKGYLPTDFVKSIITLYEKKTTLKGVIGREAEYMSSKEDFNSAYGMAATDPTKENIEYLNDWINPLDYEKNGIKKETQEELVEKYNNSKNRFLYYPWSIFITAYARRNLFTGIVECGADYLYCDTDSIKLMNYEKHREYFENYNKNVYNKLEEAMKFHGIDMNSVMPKTIKGVTKLIGVWDDEGDIKYFKTLGAKRYMTVVDNNKGLLLSITVAGVNKKMAIPYMLEKFDIKYIKTEEGFLIDYSDESKLVDVFNFFDNETMTIPKENSGKNTHTYIDDETCGYVRDYMGNISEYHEYSCVHMEEAPYVLSLADNFVNFLEFIKGR